MTVTIRTEEVVRDDGRTCKLTRRCDLCGKDISVFVRPEDFAALLGGGGYIQVLFPYLTADERELLMNGFWGPCFNSFHPPDEGER